MSRSHQGTKESGPPKRNRQDYGFRIHVGQSLSNKIQSIGSHRWEGYWGTQFWIDPQEELIGILMTQNQPGGPVRAGRKFQDAVYQAIDD